MDSSPALRFLLVGSIIHYFLLLLVQDKIILHLCEQLISSVAFIIS